jgi:hypothetical protein
VDIVRIIEKIAGKQIIYVLIDLFPPSLAWMVRSIFGVYGLWNLLYFV